MKFADTFHPNEYYHVFNRSNNGENLFKKPKHRSFFLQRYQKYLSPFVFTHSYTMPDDHFHFSLQVKDIDTIISYLQTIYPTNRTRVMKELLSSTENIEYQIDLLIVNQFQNFQNSYSKAINTDMNRKGSLFQKKFKRYRCNQGMELNYLQYYIHHNARKHGIVKDFSGYSYHSYHEIVEGESEIIDIVEVERIFGSLEGFVLFHQGTYDVSKFRDMDIEGLL